MVLPVLVSSRVINHSLRTSPPPRNLEHWMLHPLSLPKLFPQRCQCGRAWLGCTDIENARFVMIIFPSYKRVPVMSPEQRPQRHRSHVCAFLPQFRGSVPTLEQPSQFFFTSAPVVSFRYRQWNSVSIPGLAKNLFRTGRPLWTHPSSKHIGI